MKRKYFVLIISVLIWFLMVYAAISKIMIFKIFVEQLDKSPLIPDRFILIIAIIVPLIELLIAFGLTLTKFRSVALLAGFSLMLAFSLYLIVLNTFYIDVPCSCGGVLGKMSYTTHIIFNIMFTIACYIGYHINSRHE